MINLQNINLETIVLGLGSLIALIVLTLWHNDKSRNFDISSIISNADGTFSLMKFGQLTSMFTSTWVVIYQTRHAVLSEGLFSLYIITWAGSNALSKYLDSKKT